MARRYQRYFNVQITLSQEKNDLYVSARFDSCKDAALWLTEEGWSKSFGAARVGLSTVLTGRKPLYRGFDVQAERRY